jgi:hypothetical protein
MAINNLARSGENSCSAQKISNHMLATMAEHFFYGINKHSEVLTNIVLEKRGRRRVCA